MPYSFQLQLLYGMFVSFAIGEAMLYKTQGKLLNHNMTFNTHHFLHEILRSKNGNFINHKLLGNLSGLAVLVSL